MSKENVGFQHDTDGLLQDLFWHPSIDGNIDINHDESNIDSIASSKNQLPSFEDNIDVSRNESNTKTSANFEN